MDLKEHARWLKDNVEAKRYDYLLDNNSLVGDIDLMKINIEGADYELLDRMIETGFVKKIEIIQVQFHNFIEGAVEKRNSIRDELAKTHKCEWCNEFVWEQWTKI